MTRCAIVEFRDGKADTVTEYGNSWGGAARVWTSLWDKYLKDPLKPYDNWLSACMKPDDRRLWDLVDDPRLFEFERVVHFATFDNVIVRRENFEKLANHLREFSAAHPYGLDHLPAWADFLSKSDAEAIGFHHTSVNENPWAAWNDETDEPIPYDLTTGDKHMELYEAIAEAESVPGE